MIKKVFLSGWIILMIGINIYMPQYKKKTDFKTTFQEINRIAKPTDYAYSETPIAQLETAYYFKNEDKVFLYNPQNVSIPNYIGVTVVFPNSSQVSYPDAPSRTFLIHDDANYDVVIQK
jgi:hypothetical protein